MSVTTEGYARYPRNPLAATVEGSGVFEPWLKILVTKPLGVLGVRISRVEHVRLDVQGFTLNPKP